MWTATHAFRFIRYNYHNKITTICCPNIFHDFTYYPAKLNHDNLLPIGWKTVQKIDRDLLSQMGAKSWPDKFLILFLWVIVLFLIFSRMTKSSKKLYFYNIIHSYCFTMTLNNNQYIQFVCSLIVTVAPQLLLIRYSFETAV